MAFVVSEISKTPMGPKARHHRWITDSKIGDDDVAAVEHEVLSEVLELALRQGARQPTDGW